MARLNLEVSRLLYHMKEHHVNIIRPPGPMYFSSTNENIDSHGCVLMTKG